MRNFNENGRSMVEMLGVLAIIGVLSAGGLAGYSKAMFKHKLNTTMDQITMLVTNIRTAYGTQRTYTGLTTEKVYQLGALPAGIKNGTAYRNPFKGDVTVAASEARKDVPASGFTVTYKGLPKEACIALATADFGSGAGSGFVGVLVGNATAYNAEGGNLNPDVYVGSGNQPYKAGEGTAQVLDSSKTASRGEGQAYTMSQALDACGAVNQIAWKFY